MQKLSSSVTEGPGSGPAPSTAEQQPAVPTAKNEVTSAEPPTVPLFAWPPPEEDLDDWHVFSFNTDTSNTAAAPAEHPLAAAPQDSAAAPMPAPARTLVAVPPLATVSMSTAITQPLAQPPSLAATQPIAPQPLPAVSQPAAREAAPVPHTATVVRMPLNSTSRRSAAAAAIAAIADAPSAAADPEPNATPAVITAPVSTDTGRGSWGWMSRTIVAAITLIAVGEAAYIATPLVRARLQATRAPARIVVQSEPTGADVLIDGQPRGQTPLSAELPAGQHVLELRKNNLLRRLPMMLDAGARSNQYIELRASDAPAPATPSAPAPSSNSSAAATPQPAPPQPQAVPPAHVPAMTPAAAAAVLAPDAQAPAPRPVPVVGWLVVQSPLTLSILRNGELIGSSDDGRLKLAPGRHEVELTNTAAGYREATTIQIAAGQQTVLRPDLPQSTIDITATPGAKIFIDGQEVGDTPLSQLALPIGSHDILFRHPDFGDRHVTTFIKVGTPSRASIDFSTQ